MNSFEAIEKVKKKKRITWNDLLYLRKIGVSEVKISNEFGISLKKIRKKLKQIDKEEGRK